jgi:hypothetical protein
MTPAFKIPGGKSVLGVPPDVKPVEFVRFRANSSSA